MAVDASLSPDERLRLERPGNLLYGTARREREGVEALDVCQQRIGVLFSRCDLSPSHGGLWRTRAPAAAPLCCSGRSRRRLPGHGRTRAMLRTVLREIPATQDPSVCTLANAYRAPGNALCASPSVPLSVYQPGNQKPRVAATVCRTPRRRENFRRLARVGAPPCRVRHSDSVCCRTGGSVFRHGSRPTYRSSRGREGWSSRSWREMSRFYVSQF